MNFLQKGLPLDEGVAAWAAAASTAKAFLPKLVEKRIKSLDSIAPLTIALAVIEAADQALQENEGYFPPPRGMEVGIYPGGDWALVWESDSHTIILKGSSERYIAVLQISRPEDESITDSPRTAAAVAASPTLQKEGWH